MRCVICSRDFICIYLRVKAVHLIRRGKYTMSQSRKLGYGISIELCNTDSHTQLKISSIELSRLVHLYHIVSPKQYIILFCLGFGGKYCLMSSVPKSVGYSFCMRSIWRGWSYLRVRPNIYIVRGVTNHYGGRHWWGRLQSGYGWPFSLFEWHCLLMVQDSRSLVSSNLSAGLKWSRSNEYWIVGWTLINVQFM